MKILTLVAISSLLVVGCVTKKEMFRYGEICRNTGRIEGISEGSKKWEESYIRLEEDIKFWKEIYFDRQKDVNNNVEKDIWLTGKLTNELRRLQSVIFSLPLGEKKNKLVKDHKSILDTIQRICERSLKK